jgi:thiosulfate/3-mercaptopyruvate sulfurtransferase
MKTHIDRSIVFVFALFVAIAVPSLAKTRDEMLVATGWLERNQRNVTILHIGDRAGYDAGHIPGARLIETTALLVQRDGIPNELPPIDALEKVFRASGAGSRGRIVVYSNDPLFAARAWFTLDYLGQGKRASLLDGGLAKWKAEGRALSRENMLPRPGSFEARVDPDAVIRLDMMRKMVRLRERIAPGLVFIDARPPAQFTGEEAGPDVRHAGRIPGSINLPMAIHFAADGTFRSAGDLRRLYDDAGVSKDLLNVTYCRTGMQASVNYFVLRYLGYEAALYDGSYLEWSNAGELIES